MDKIVNFGETITYKINDVSSIGTIIFSADLPQLNKKYVWSNNIGIKLIKKVSIHTKDKLVDSIP